MDRHASTCGQLRGGENSIEVLQDPFGMVDSTGYSFSFPSGHCCRCCEEDTGEVLSYSGGALEVLDSAPISWVIGQFSVSLGRKGTNGGLEWCGV